MRAVVFEHDQDRALIDAEPPSVDPIFTRIERVEKAVVGVERPVFVAFHRFQRGVGFRRSKRERSAGCRRGDRAVVGDAGGRSSAGVVRPFAVGAGSRPVAGGESPDIGAVSDVFTRIFDAVATVGQRGSPGIFEIIETRFGAHEGVLDPCEIDPHVRILVPEQRREVHHLVVLETAVIVGSRPAVPYAAVEFFVGLGRADCEDVEDHGFVVTLPGVRLEAGFGSPAETHQFALVHRPFPVHCAVQFVGQPPDFVFYGIVPVVIGLGGQDTGHQQSGVDRREFVLSFPETGVPVQKMIEESLVSGRKYRVGAFRRIVERP